MTPWARTEYRRTLDNRRQVRDQATPSGVLALRASPPLISHLPTAPVVTIVVACVSFVCSSLVGVEDGFDLLWILSNAILHSILLGWILVRPGGRAAGPISSGVLVGFVLLVYGSWGPALAAANVTSQVAPLVPGSVSVAALQYTTWAACAVSASLGAVAICFGSVHGFQARVDRRPAVSSPQWWHGALVVEAMGLLCLVLYKISSHEPVLNFSLFSTSPAPSQGLNSAGGPYGFLSAGIDLSIGAGIAAAGLLSERRYRRPVIALLIGNLVIYSTLGFKYRLVVLLLGVFGVLMSRSDGRTRNRRGSVRPAIALLALVWICGVFFVVQVFRGQHESGSQVTAGSFSFTHITSIATSSINIATPYAAIHQEQSRLLLGRSYVELPSLFIPRVVVGRKAEPTMASVIQAVTVTGAGAATPLWAEADVNFGVPGLLGFGAVLGWVVSRSDTADRRRLETVTLVSAIGAVLASVLSRSLMFFALYEFAAIVLPIWVLGRRGRRKVARPLLLRAYDG